MKNHNRFAGLFIRRRRRDSSKDSSSALRRDSFHFPIYIFFNKWRDFFSRFVRVRSNSMNRRAVGHAACVAISFAFSFCFFWLFCVCFGSFCDRTGRYIGLDERDVFMTAFIGQHGINHRSAASQRGFGVEREGGSGFRYHGNGDPGHLGKLFTNLIYQTWCSPS